MHGPIVFQVISELLLPEEISCAFALSFVETIDNISVVNFNGNQSHNNLTNDGWNLSSDDGCEFF